MPEKVELMSNNLLQGIKHRSPDKVIHSPFGAFRIHKQNRYLHCN